MLVNDGEMLVNGSEISVWSFAHLTIIEKLYQLQGNMPPINKQ